MNLGGDNSVPAAPDLPAADEVANSMYGGSAEIFENPAAEMPPPPLPSDQEPTSSESLESEEEESEDDESSQEAELPPGCRQFLRKAYLKVGPWSSGPIMVKSG